MSRQYRFFAGLFVGYAAWGANLVYTVCSVPLALHFLPKAEFGLWALVTQIGAYLALLDLGMTSSVARFLADQKDSMDRGEYGMILRTGRWVFGTQAVLVLLVALVCAFFLPSFLEIPAPLIFQFQILLVGQGCLQAVGLALRAESSPLWAHQRIDITHWATSANLLTSLMVMAGGFFAGWGIYSFLVGALMGSLWSWFFPWMSCLRLGLLSTQQRGRKFQISLFYRMIRFGWDVLLLQLGGVLCSASPLILVTKMLGLEAAAVYSIVTKTSTMGQQIIGRILESAAPGLTEIFVRGELSKFTRRFYQVCSISLVAAASLAVGLMTANRDFVSIWTHDAIQWSRFGDFLLASSLIATVGIRCFQGVFGMSADFSRVRWLALLEGAVFIGITLLLGSSIGIEGVLAVALGTQILISLIPSMFQTWKTFPSRSFWKKCPAWILAVFLLASFISSSLMTFAEKPSLNIASASFLMSAAAFFLFLGLRKQLSGQASP